MVMDPQIKVSGSSSSNFISTFCLKVYSFFLEFEECTLIFQRLLWASEVDSEDFGNLVEEEEEEARESEEGSPL